MDIRLVKICPLVWWGQIWDFWFQPTCLCEMQTTESERMISACVVRTMKHGGGGGGVMLWGCFAGDTVSDLFRIKDTLNHHGNHSILLRYAIPSGLRLLGLWFVFQQEKDPKHTSRLCKGYLTKKESDGVLHQMTWSPQSPDLNPIEMVGNELDRRVKETASKCSACGNSLLEKHSSWSWLRECQDCVKLSSRQRMALKNPKYI